MNYMFFLAGLQKKEEIKKERKESNAIFIFQKNPHFLFCLHLNSNPSIHSSCLSALLHTVLFACPTCIEGLLCG